MFLGKSLEIKPDTHAGLLSRVKLKLTVQELGPAMQYLGGGFIALPLANAGIVG